MKEDIKNKIKNQPSYWVEHINGLLYNALVVFMEKYKMKQKDLAVHLGISPGRVSQILNGGNINFSIEKFVEISLKLDCYPDFRLVAKPRESGVHMSEMRRSSMGNHEVK
ncbi:MAG: helix-turn-helix domain-containing protein [Cyclobacteriaceae bacterium]|nr:helix-turn-helix domain-containing protein [Cyclobacteriaceae bacterium]